MSPRTRILLGSNEEAEYLFPGSRVVRNAAPILIGSKGLSSVLVFLGTSYFEASE